MYIILPLLLLLAGSPGALKAQLSDTVDSSLPRVQGLPTLGSTTEDRLRVAQIVGLEPSTGYLIRSASSLAEWPVAESRLSWSVIAPHMSLTRNSDLPRSFNDGAMWAGRGYNINASAGVRAKYNRFTLILAPQLLFIENSDFQTLPYPADRGPRRSPFANPFHFPPESLDIPLRFGDESSFAASLGQSSFTIDAGAVAVGAATENLWWGPGIRNAIVMSNHAEGIPHLFIRTARPFETPIGTFTGRWILGALKESDYFNFDSSDDDRSISALAISLQTGFDPDLSLGFARAVYAPFDGGIVPFSAALDVFRNVGRPASSPADEVVEPGPDQLFSLFGRWVFSASGFEAYAEWARYEQPASLRDFLEMPNHSQGYTLGLQWVRPVLTDRHFRLQTEVTFLEPSATYRVRPVHDWYSSRAVPQGYTNEGQVIGASIGPGASSQWLAGDLMSDRWQLGAFAGRIRWDSHVFQRFVTTQYGESDVSMFTGLRAAGQWRGTEISAKYTAGIRLNYLFQARLEPKGILHQGVDITNHSMELAVNFNAREFLRYD